jgi:DNA-binding response OmpR family regulator
MNKDIHILVVEDDADISSLLCSIIRKSGYMPQPAFSGTEALLQLERRTWEMVLLDLMLPGMTGEQVLEKLGGTGVPVMIVSAKNESRTKVAALLGGADDFITKPFDVEEVSARIESLLRRYSRTAQPIVQNVLRHKGLELDGEAKSVKVNGEELALTAREYEMMALLLSSPKKVFTKANLYESVWGEAYYGDDNTINVHMSHLRGKLAKAAPDVEWIETVWGIGYRLQP